MLKRKTKDKPHICVLVEGLLVKRKIPSPSWELNRRTLIVQLVAATVAMSSPGSE
jgi:hypothetical protein